jgi:hypothetical protein
MKNQLPGGCHTSDDEAKRQESISVPKHNRASEKNFADMKQYDISNQMHLLNTSRPH